MFKGMNCGKERSWCCFIGGHFVCSVKACLPGKSRQSGSAVRFPGLLTHGTIRENALEAHGKGLNVLLILVEGTERPLDGNRYPVCTLAIVSATL